MKLKLPAEFVTTLILDDETMGIHSSWQLTFTVFGELLALQNDLLMLPPEAHLFMFDKAGREAIAVLRRTQERIPQLLPLIALEVERGSSWPPLKQEFCRMKALPAFRSLVPGRYIEDKWISNLWACTTYLEKVYVRTARDLLSLQPFLRAEALKRVNRYNFYLLEPVLLYLAKTADLARVRQKARALLGRYGSSQALNWYFAELETDLPAARHHVALIGLADFRMYAVRDKLLMYYRGKRFQDNLSQALLLQALANYPEERVALILLENLGDTDPKIAGSAHLGLRRCGTDKELIRQTLYRLFQARNSRAQMLVVLEHYRWLKQPKYLPEISELMDLIVWSNRSAVDEQMNTALLQLLVKRKEKSLYDGLIKLITEPSGATRLAALDLLAQLGTPEQMPVVLQVIREGTHDFLRVQCSKTLISIAERHAYPAFGAYLRKLANQADSEFTRGFVQLFIRKDKPASFVARITPLLSLPGDRDEEVTFILIEALARINDPECRIRLRRYEMDTNQAVSRRAVQTFKSLQREASEQYLRKTYYFDEPLQRILMVVCGLLLAWTLLYLAQ